MKRTALRGYLCIFFLGIICVASGFPIFLFRNTSGAGEFTFNPGHGIPPKSSPLVGSAGDDIAIKSAASSIEAMIIFSMIRFDLLVQHLSSIDFPVEKVFIIHNYATEKSKVNTISQLDRYRYCNNLKGFLDQVSIVEGCENANIRSLDVLTTAHNVGFSGSVNFGIKLMMAFKFRYAFFNSDDIRYRPKRLDVARSIIHRNLDVCIFHFEGYASFVLTLEGAKRVGPFDENFWPAYAEDCDYWLRVQLAGCRAFYRGGYVPGQATAASLVNAYVDHGDPSTLSVSVTLRSHAELGSLVQGTLDSKRGRSAYLARKWGEDSCAYYHDVLHTWRENDVFLEPAPKDELDAHGPFSEHPYKDSTMSIRTWSRIWNDTGTVSPRAVNVENAPIELVWQQDDFVVLDATLVSQ
mmetsp:Transcript_12742/g.53925  ORF Transcript_12742/g.53925 Transcript_12742/m.53925 type:complete len:409 (-) Transcript_12742:309-1535(-)